MAGCGPAPKANSRTRHKPLRGSWQPTPDAGWQHGDIPDAPPGLMPSTAAVWLVWFRSWWATNWTPDYLPQITTAIRLYDDVERGNLRSATELRQAMDGIGASFKGQQDRRWTRAIPDAPSTTVTPEQPAGSYGHLRSLPPAATG